MPQKQNKTILELTQGLSDYISPNILGNKLLKKFLTLQLFVNPHEGEKFHLLLVGSTACGKTEIAQFINKIMSGRSAFIQKDATSVGIREILMRNPQILFIDEFDKMKKDTRSMLLESMQSQTVTTAKHNEYVVSDAKVNVTALCNPIRSELNKDAPLSSQVSFSKEYFLLSRFHIIIPVFAPESFLYGDIAEGMEKKRYTEENLITKLRELVYKVKFDYPTVSIDLPLARKVGDYIHYLKDMNPNNILITARLIEGFLSAMKARARMCQRDKCSSSDLDYIKDLYKQIL